MSLIEGAIPLNNEPLGYDEHVAQRSVSIFTLHSKSPFGMFLNNPVDDTPIGSDLRELVIAGSGIYVVDCPIGWPGRLLLNDDVEYEIFPGCVIPDRYTRVKLIKAPVSTSGLTADSPIILALGPRGHEYRKPGRRYHVWRSRSSGINGFSIPGVTTSSPGNFMTTKGYDFWCLLLSLSNGASGELYGVLTEHNPIDQGYSTPTQTLQISDINIYGNAVGFPAWGTGPLYNEASGSKPVTTLDGQTTFDYRLAGGVTGNPAMPHSFGWVQESVRFSIANRQGTARTVTLSAIASVEVK